MEQKIKLDALRSYAEASRSQAAEAAEHGNLPLAEELSARAEEAEELCRRVQ